MIRHVETTLTVWLWRQRNKVGEIRYFYTSVDGRTQAMVQGTIRFASFFLASSPSSSPSLAWLRSFFDFTLFLFGTVLFYSGHQSEEPEGGWFKFDDAPKCHGGFRKMLTLVIWCKYDDKSAPNYTAQRKWGKNQNAQTLELTRSKMHYTFGIHISLYNNCGTCLP